MASGYGRANTNSLGLVNPGAQTPQQQMMRSLGNQPPSMFSAPQAPRPTANPLLQGQALPGQSDPNRASQMAMGQNMMAGGIDQFNPESNTWQNFGYQGAAGGPAPMMRESGPLTQGNPIMGGAEAYMNRTNPLTSNSLIRSIQGPRHSEMGQQQSSLLSRLLQ